MMQALILASGLGTRLRPLTNSLPKVMVPVGGKPFLEIILEKLHDQGFREILITTSYFAEKIENHFKDGKNWGLNIRYSRSPKILGTAGTIKFAEPLLDDTFFVFNGDSYSQFDYSKLTEFHLRHSFDISISLVFKPDASRYGSVEIDDERVQRFMEKSNQKKGGYINSGVYIMNKSVIDGLKDNQFISLEEEIFPKLVNQKKIGGYAFNGYFIDIGTFPSYERFIRDYQNGKI